MNTKRLVLWGLVQTVATVVVVVVAVVMVQQLQEWESPSDGQLDKIALLLVLVTSALVSATLLLAYPSYLLLQRRVNEGFMLLLCTIGWLVLVLAGILAVIVVGDIHVLI